MYCTATKLAEIQKLLADKRSVKPRTPNYLPIVDTNSYSVSIGPTQKKVVHQGNHLGTSAGMEQALIPEFLTWVTEQPAAFLKYLDSFCTDRDAGAMKVIRTRFPRVSVKNDGGHFKNIKKILGNAKFYANFPMRIATAWMYILIQSVQESHGILTDIEPIMRKYLSTLYSHFSEETCEENCWCIPSKTHTGVCILIRLPPCLVLIFDIAVGIRVHWQEAKGCLVQAEIFHEEVP